MVIESAWFMRQLAQPCLGLTKGCSLSRAVQGCMRLAVVLHTAANPQLSNAKKNCRAQLCHIGQDVDDAKMKLTS